MTIPCRFHISVQEILLADNCQLASGEAYIVLQNDRYGRLLSAPGVYVQLCDQYNLVPIVCAFSRSMSTHRLKYLSAQAGAYSALVLRNQHRVDEVVQEPSIVQRHF